ncbi:MAG: hypothetical protein JW902_08055, partial [Syntrophaceae bacterium]|nr:hypothetical protein [Syntrophaceae bacterium]
ADSVYDRGPQGLNRYSYALNNPLLYRDPTGKMSNPFATFFSGWHHTPNPVREALGKTLQAEAQGIKAGMIEGTTTGALVYTSLAVPGVGESLDLAVILGGDRTTTTQKIAAGASLVISALTIGLGPNYGALNDTMVFPSDPSSGLPKALAEFVPPRGFKKS